MSTINNTGFFMPVKPWVLTGNTFPVMDHPVTVQDSTIMNTLRKLGNFFLVAAANKGISLVNSLLGRVGVHQNFVSEDPSLSLTELDIRSDLEEMSHPGITDDRVYQAYLAENSWVDQTTGKRHFYPNK